MKKIIITLFGVAFTILTLNTLYASIASVGINKDVAGLDTKPTKNRPFAPSMLRTKNNHQATLDSFENPETCAGCHPKQYEGWRGSMHSHAWNDPIFQAEFKKGLKATDGKIFNLCAGCHSPIGVLTGTAKWNKETNELTNSEKGARGVTCDVCHSIAGAVPLTDTITSEHGNGSHIIDTATHIKYGPLKNSKSPYHQTQYSELHTKANLCASCHNIIHPVNGTPIERTYDEWRVSPYAQNKIVCQDCHMNSVEVAIEIAKTLKRPEELEKFNLGGKASTLGVTDHSVVHPHEFVGGNTVVTQMLEPNSLRKRKHTEIAKKRLQNAAELKVDLTQRKDGLFNLNVDVYNVGAGHNIPTSLTQVRHIWIEATVSNEQGEVLFETGKLNSHNDLDEDKTVIFRTWTVDADGNDTHDPWAINHLVRDTTIPPKGHSKHDFVFDHQGNGKIKVEVKLNYRSLTQHIAEDLLGKDAPIIPTINMRHVLKTYIKGTDNWTEVGKSTTTKEKITH